VHVRVAEGGEREPAAQVHHPGERADPIVYLVVGAERQHHTAADRRRLREPGRMGGSTDLPADEN
jgi:hypothetical protein